MNRLFKKQQNLLQRKRKIRRSIRGTAGRPRLCVYVSNKHISAQIIDDDKQHTIVSATTVGRDKKLTDTMTDRATAIGGEIAKLASKKKIGQVVFDRNGRLYHGRIQALADAARKNGLEF
jgi:large subunit ribosomal protein L18